MMALCAKGTLGDQAVHLQTTYAGQRKRGGTLVWLVTVLLVNAKRLQSLNYSGFLTLLWGQDTTMGIG